MARRVGSADVNAYSMDLRERVIADCDAGLGTLRLQEEAVRLLDRLIAQAQQNQQQQSSSSSSSQQQNQQQQSQQQAGQQQSQQQQAQASAQARSNEGQGEVAGRTPSPSHPRPGARQPGATCPSTSVRRSRKGSRTSSARCISR